MISSQEIIGIFVEWVTFQRAWEDGWELKTWGQEEGHSERAQMKRWETVEEGQGTASCPISLAGGEWKAQIPETVCQFGSLGTIPHQRFG